MTGTRKLEHGRNIALEFYHADEFWEFKKWPDWARKAFFNPKKNGDERFKLFLFFWKSGMEPERAYYWVMWHRTYDTNAYMRLRDALNKTRTAKGRAYLNRIPVLDMATGVVHPLSENNRKKSHIWYENYE